METPPITTILPGDEAPSGSLIARRCVDYGQHRWEIDNGMIALFRPRGLGGRAIASAGRSEYCHAGLVGWWYHRLMLIDTTALGARARLFSAVLAQHHGRIDLFDVEGDRRGGYLPNKALKAAIDLTGQRYGWLTLARAAASRLPGVRWCLPPLVNDATASRWPPICSEAVSMALRAGGVDPVPNLADRATEPGDLARSAKLHYRFTPLGAE